MDLSKKKSYKKITHQCPRVIFLALLRALDRLPIHPLTPNFLRSSSPPWLAKAISAAANNFFAVLSLRRSICVAS